MNTNETLKEALLEKYNRTKTILETSDDDEEYNAAENDMNDIIRELQALNKVEEEYYAKQEERRIEEEHNKEVLEMEKMKLEEHTKVEEKRNEAALNLEHEKQKLTWQKVAFEAGRILLPTILSAAVYFKAQRKVLEFEETGRINSTPGRELRLPKFPWK
jgi:chemotaxis protein histidine kinase CheA